MTLATKAELRDDVAAWLSREDEPDFLARFDTFLALTEADFGTKLRASVIERRLDAVVNERWEKNPAGTNQVRSVVILNNGNYQFPPLSFLPYQDIIKRYGTTSSTPIKAYTLVGNQIGFFPFPLEDLTSTLRFEVIAYVRPDPLTTDDSDNEVLLVYPNVYFYGVLVQTAPYYGRDEDLVKWGQLYGQAIADANQEASSKPGDILIERVA